MNTTFSKMTSSLIVKILFLVFLTATNFARSVEPPKGADQTKAVEIALSRFLKAFENLDWETFRKAFRDDATVFFPTPEPPNRFEGRAAFEEQFKKVFAAIRSGASKGPPFHLLVPEDVRIDQVSEDAAIVTFHLRNKERIARRTIVFKRTEGEWLIAHLHASNV